MDQDGNPNMPWRFPSERYLKNYLDNIIEAVETQQPFSVIRIGDGELMVLQQGLIHPIEYLVKNVPWASGYGYCGTILPNIELRTRMIDAIKYADLVGVFDGDPPMMDVFKVIEERYGVTPKNIFYAFDNLFLPMNKDFVKLMVKYPPLLVGNSAKRFAEYIKNELGIVVPGTLECPDCRHIDATIEAMGKIEHRWSLVSAGVCAKVICPEMARRYGKVAFDFGHAPDNVMAPDYKEYWLVKPD